MSSLRFYSWLRRGLAQAIDQQADARGQPASATATVDVGLKLAGIANPVKQSLQLRGPGDIVGLDSAQIVRTEPKPHTRDFASNYFPFVELVSADLPWLFTPARPDQKTGRLQPWIVLVVVDKQAEVKLTGGTADRASVLQIESGAGHMLPDLAEAYAWTHVQETVLADEPDASIETKFENSPAAFVARILCSVRLKPHTEFFACLVPAFEAGRRAGLGLDVADAGFEDAWNRNTDRIELPVYYSWSFATGEGDFEGLARKLRPHPVDRSVGLYDLDITRPGGGLDVEDLAIDNWNQRRALISFQGVLTSPSAKKRPWFAAHKKAFQSKLKSVLTGDAASASAASGPYKALEQDPIVSPPVYGSWQSRRRHIKKISNLPLWMQQLNQDPAQRSVAGIATRVVRRHQEELMADAWQQARNARAAQQALRNSRLALTVNSRVHSRLVQLSDAAWLQLTSAAHKRLKLSEASGSTMAHSIKMSAYVPTGIITSEFRRMAQIQQTRLNHTQGDQAAATAGLAKQITTHCIRGTPGVARLAQFAPSANIGFAKSYEFNNVSSSSRAKTTKTAKVKISGSRDAKFNQYARATPVRATALPNDHFKQPQVEKDLELASLAADLRRRTDPTQVVTDHLFKRVRGLAEPKDQMVAIPKKATVTPAFPEPAYKKLQAMAPEFFLPGIGRIPPDSVSLLAVNASFVESYLIGLNHEMSREFAWREYPARLSGTWFKRFWDYVSEPDQEDIEAIGGWKSRSALGRHAYGFKPADGNDDRIVVLIKGELLRRYPQTIIYAVKADWLRQQNSATIRRGPFKPLAGSGPGTGGWVREAADMTVETNIRLPLFRGEIGSDAHFLGFDLSLDEVYGSTVLGEKNAGWFFVFEEHVSAPRFGLDQAGSFSPNRAPSRIQQLSWGHFAADDDQLSALTHATILVPWAGTPVDGHKWGNTSAEIARMTYQHPIRLLFHADALVSKPKTEA